MCSRMIRELDPLESFNSLHFGGYKWRHAYVWTHLDFLTLPYGNPCNKIMTF